MTTDLQRIPEFLGSKQTLKVYNLKGQLLKDTKGMTIEDIKQTLPKGIYIINGQKTIIK